jgi:HPt (histidine-containing phosphotransfer) domain-containing protein
MNDANPPPGGLDAQALARLRELDPEGRLGVMSRVLAAFEKSVQRMVTQLEAQQGAADAQLVANLAHTLKSSSASVGALSLSRACADVESKIRKGDTSAMHLDIPRLIAEGQAALLAVGAILRP